MNSEENSHGDREKYRLVSELYIKYENDLYYYASGILEDHFGAMDMVHAAFVSVLENIDKLQFDDERATRSLLFKIVRNFCLNEKRSARIRRCRAEEDQKNNTQDVEFEHAVAGEITGIINDIQKVNKAYADVLIYSAIGLKCVEIAKIYGVSPSLVRQRLSRARKVMKHELGKKGYGDDF